MKLKIISQSEGEYTWMLQADEAADDSGLKITTSQQFKRIEDAWNASRNTAKRLGIDVTEGMLG